MTAAAATSTPITIITASRSPTVDGRAQVRSVSEPKPFASIAVARRLPRRIASTSSEKLRAPRLLSAAIALRVLAIGLPSVVLIATTDPTDLADGLAQILRLPARFVLGGLAGMRLVGLLTDDWRTLAMARRARGVADGRGPIAALRSLGARSFSLLVLAIRRGSRLATAMEAKGFGADTPRSWARESRLGRFDVLLVLGGAVIAAAAVAVSVLTGAWSFVLHA